jgi:hypothetical protein
MVYFRGALTGKPFDKNGNPIGRHKLMNMAIEHPEDILVGFTKFQENDPFLIPK